MLGRLRRTIKAATFALVRPLFVEDVDSNEDFVCAICGDPVLLRHLTCGKSECRSIAKCMF